MRLAPPPNDGVVAKRTGSGLGPVVALESAVAAGRGGAADRRPEGLAGPRLAAPGVGLLFLPALTWLPLSRAPPSPAAWAVSRTLWASRVLRRASSVGRRQERVESRGRRQSAVSSIGLQKIAGWQIPRYTPGPRRM